VQGRDIPVALLAEFISDSALDPPLHALTVDYERGSWRADALAEHLVDWTIDYALRPKERTPAPARLRAAVADAVRRTFGSGGDRGIAGELLLHLACRQLFGSDTVINKVVFKSSKNETYRGFDGVHVCTGRPGSSCGSGRPSSTATCQVPSAVHSTRSSGIWRRPTCAMSSPS
jgi:hypothetical protein